jgi:UDP-glucuronate 4-epimerase
MKNILVTGSAGFVGFHLVKSLLKYGYNVVGVDNLNDYYDPQLKLDRLKEIDNSHIPLKSFYKFIEMDICDESLQNIFLEFNFDIVINLAAQAGVRYSITNPKAYIDSNIIGFSNILECCKNKDIEHLIFASSSSVYGMNNKQPFSASDNTDFPISLYAATKKSNELQAFSYSHLFKIPTTGLRFFTVYGPYGRPDMAYYKFTKAIHEGTPIEIFNNGKMQRDFTYIDDIVDGILKIIKKPPSLKKPKTSNAEAPFEVFNIGNNNPVTLEHFIEVIEKSLGKKAIKKSLPMQPGDVPITFADVDPLIDKYNFKPSTSIEVGLSNFVSWYLNFKS